jgi:STE24 endopeptidase
MLYSAFYLSSKSVYAGLIFFGMLYAPIDLILSLFMNIRSRKHEYDADKFSVTNTKDPQSMIDALKKLSEHNLSNLTPHPFYAFLHYSHPPVIQRIEAIKSIKSMEN